MDLPNFQAAEVIVVAIEIALLLAGVGVLFRWQFSERALDCKQIRVSPWPIPLSDLLLRALCVVLGAIILPMIVLSVQKARPAALSDDLWLVTQACAFQIGMLFGVGVGNAFSKARRAPLPELDASTSAMGELPPETAESAITLTPWRINPLLAGLLTFLAAMPLVVATSLLWNPLLKWAGFPVDTQELIELLANSESPALIIGMGILAVVLAPLVEETIFRAGLFRYLRTRIPRSLALLLSAVLFSSLHASLAAFGPLVVFGVVLAIAYERTGRILVPIVAHGLFNLHTLILLLSGVTP
ncbi:MAG TPA: CPBP family intramembrane metalloprotease [Opitutaceae bacterium]|nr:CPBP family intramembrane metalloprotease [Opitutaceae bacterium]